MPSETELKARPAASFWVLGTFVIAVFCLGGSSRGDVATLVVLRPMSMLVAAYGVYTLKREHWRSYWPILVILGAALLLLVAQLIPLPREIWQGLPGREAVQRIDALMNAPARWRPFSMVPDATENALYSMAVPIGVFTLAAQLDPRDHNRLLLLLIALAVTSGLLGLFQAMGGDIFIFEKSSETPGLFANRNHQGILLSMLLPMLATAAFWGSSIMPRRVTSIGAGAVALITVPLIVVTGSRAGLIALILAVALVPVIGLYRTRGRSLPPGGSIAAYGIAAACFIGLLWMTAFASRDTALIRFEQVDEDLRYPVWVSIVDSLPHYLPWGTGIGSYVEVYQIMEPNRLLRPTFSNHAHNEWLEIALTAGIPGLALLACAALLYCIGIWRALRSSGSQGAFSRLGIGLILLLSFASTFDYPVRTPIMASVLAIAAVWACSYKRFGNEDWRR